MLLNRPHKFTTMKSSHKKIFIIAALFMAVLSACTDTETASPTGDDRDLFTGTLNCTENSTLYGAGSYTVNISKIGNLDSIEIKNFYQLGNNTKTTALISGNSITIPNQSVTGINVYGTGILSNSKVNLTYYAIDGSLKDTVNATYQ